MFNKFILDVARVLAKNVGFRVVCCPSDMDSEFAEIYSLCEDYTMTGVDRMYALYKAIEYIDRTKIPGDIVECGVWRGGSCMLCAHALRKLGDIDRRMFLYDTYEGMAEPTNVDISLDDESAHATWKVAQGDHDEGWCRASLNEVRSNMMKTGYAEDKIEYIVGKVEDTIPGVIPDKIALLRLDTDWFESTYHELQHLFPRLVPNGVLIIDDYGFWKGSRKATDQYFEENNVGILLNRIDAAGRLGIKIDT